VTRFLVHCHAAGRRHYDLRLIDDLEVRSWSMLREPPLRAGDRRLAIEREVLSIEQIHRPRIEEEAFGEGRARIWDAGEVEVAAPAPGRIGLIFAGTKLAGRYEMRRMRWYPGNRWLMEKYGA
jgi:bifunctional non-homologous end joining protein LigD